MPETDPNDLTELCDFFILLDRWAREERTINEQQETHGAAHPGSEREPSCRDER
jgi:hypothetical protein